MRCNLRPICGHLSHADSDNEARAYKRKWTELSRLRLLFVTIDVLYLVIDPSADHLAKWLLDIILMFLKINKCIDQPVAHNKISTSEASFCWITICFYQNDAVGLQFLSRYASASFALCLHAAAVFQAQSTAFYLENVQLNCTKCTECTECCTECTTSRHFEIQNQFFSGEGAQPLPRPVP